MSFQENLRKYREARGVNAKEFANQLGIKYTTYLSYETAGKEPKIENLCKIAAALHVSTDELLGYQVDKLANLLNRLGEHFECVESSIPGEVTFIYWSFLEDKAAGKEPKWKKDFNKEVLTDLLESLSENASKITESTTREILEQNVLSYVFHIEVVNLSVDTNRTIK